MPSLLFPCKFRKQILKLYLKAQQMNYANQAPTTNLKTMYDLL